MKAATASTASTTASTEAPAVIGLYLREIGQLPRSTLEQDLALASELQLALRFNNVTLARQLRNQFVEHHLKLAFREAKKFAGSGVPLADLVQEANIGLIRAAEKFDPTRQGPTAQPIHFSTYAVWWIRQHLLRAASEQGDGYRLPAHAADAIRRYRKTRARLTQELGRDPSDEEVATALGISMTALEDLQVPTVVSLDEPVHGGEAWGGSGGGNDGGGAEPVTLAMLLEAPTDQHEEEAREDYRLLFKRVGLTPREKRIVELRFGLHDGLPRTLLETAAEFGCSAERVRQLEAKALEKLKRHGMTRDELMAA